MTMCNNLKIVESTREDGQYGMMCTVAIVDHPKHGRILITEGYGGEGQLRGGQYRWEHGMVIKLLPTDTFDSLSAGPWNDTVTLLEAVYGGYDDARPVLRWDGSAIASLAGGLGL